VEAEFRKKVKSLFKTAMEEMRPRFVGETVPGDPFLRNGMCCIGGKVEGSPAFFVLLWINPKGATVLQLSAGGASGGGGRTWRSF
jgi:hypothetical protein